MIGLGNVHSLFAQAYRIECKIAGMKDEYCYLLSYFGKSNSIVDSVQMDGTGGLVFQGKKALDPGMYMIVKKGKPNSVKLFDIIINDKQSFSCKTDTNDYVGYMKITGSPENEAFYGYQQYLGEMSKKVKPYQDEMAKLKGKQDEKSKKDSTALVGKMKDIDEEVKKHQVELINKHSGTFFASFLKAVREPEIPKPAPGEKRDPSFDYYYFRNHYFDNISFTDPRMWRTPMFYNKIEYYLDKLLPQHPDTLNREIAKLVDKARPNKDMFKYMVSSMTYKYETSNVVGFDAIFVHLADLYYKTRQADWVHDTVIKKVCDRAESLRPILVGKPGPNLHMQNEKLQLVELKKVDARYTIVFFMDPDCGHCKKEMLGIKDLYNKRKSDWGLEVFAVYCDTSMEKMNKYIKEYQLQWINVNGPRNLNTPYDKLYDIRSTPQIFILDRDKKIISKRLAAEQVEDFIKHHIKREEEEGNG